MPVKVEHVEVASVHAPVRENVEEVEPTIRYTLTVVGIGQASDFAAIVASLRASGHVLEVATLVNENGSRVINHLLVGAT